MAVRRDFEKLPQKEVTCLHGDKAVRVPYTSRILNGRYYTAGTDNACGINSLGAHGWHVLAVIKLMESISGKLQHKSAYKKNQKRTTE
jgi:hypothetical protein